MYKHYIACSYKAGFICFNRYINVYVFLFSFKIKQLCFNIFHQAKIENGSDVPYIENYYRNRYNFCMKIFFYTETYYRSCV